MLLGGTVVTATAQGKKSDWHVADAKHRLLVVSPSSYATAFWLDIPEELQRAGLHAVVTDATGAPVPSRPLTVNSIVVGTEISVPTAYRKGRSTLSPTKFAANALHVYLTPTASPAPAVESATPIVVSCVTERAVARPDSCKDVRQMFENGPRTAILRQLAVFPDEDFRAYLADEIPIRSSSTYMYHKWRYHLTARIVLDAPQTISLAVPQLDSGASFAFMDHEDFFSWCDPNRQNGQVISKPLALSAGAHRLDFVGIVGRKESFPELKWRLHTDSGTKKGAAAAASGYVPIPAAVLRSSYTADTVAIESVDGDFVPTARIIGSHKYRFFNTDTKLTIGSFSDLSINKTDNEIVSRRLSIDGMDLGDVGTDSTIIYPTRYRHKAEMTWSDGKLFKRTGNFVVKEPWGITRVLHVKFKLNQFSFIEPREGPLVLPYKLDFDPPYDDPQYPNAKQFLKEGWPDSVKSQARITVTMWDGENRLSKEVLPVPASPFTRAVSIDLPETKWSHVTIGATITDQLIAPPYSVHNVASSDKLPAFKRTSHQLKVNDGFALIQRRDPNPDNAPAPPATASKNIVVIDDFIATELHISDDLPLQQHLAEKTGLSVDHIPLGIEKFRTQHPYLTKYEILSKVLKENRHDTIVWMIGEDDILGGFDQRDFSAQLGYLVRATLEHGKLPILTTLPVSERLPTEHLRAYALIVKELGASYRIPVVDLYSASLLGGGIGRFYDIGEGPAILSATPNAEGREWMLQPLVNIFEQQKKK
jgi:hypothetical protein